MCLSDKNLIRVKYQNELYLNDIIFESFIENNNNLSTPVQKVKEVYHIYRSGSGASTPSCNVPHYGSTSKRYNPYSRYQDNYGSNRSSNGFRLLKFGDTLIERSIENELDPNENIECSQEKTNDLHENIENTDCNEFGKRYDN